MSDLYIWRSNNPLVLDSWDAMVAADAEWQRMGAKLIRKLKRAIGDGRKREGVAFSGGITGRRQFAGLTNYGPVPEGWRKVGRKYDGYIVPKKTTPEGKALAAEIEATTIPDPRTLVPGIPSHAWAGVHIGHPGLKIHSDGYLYATWSVNPGDDKIDLSMWEPVKLSAYYALVESEEDTNIEEPTS